MSTISYSKQAKTQHDTSSPPKQDQDNNPSKPMEYHSYLYST